ncbi:MAG: type II toxin-antitoxin system VapC family toxin [Propionibacteriaceae bacterium]|nr:type II toxin-antitoxin system VapC family toxin [Propionibacteriaceae bacterium]
MRLLDTDVLICHLRGKQVAHDWLVEARIADKLCASVVTVVELIGGMRSAEKAQVLRLVSSLRILPVTEVVARRAGEFMRIYRASHQGVSTADYMIAATADIEGAYLATLNVKHYPMFADLRPAFKLD